MVLEISNLLNIFCFDFDINPIIGQRIFSSMHELLSFDCISLLSLSKIGSKITSDLLFHSDHGDITSICYTFIFKKSTSVHLLST